MVSATRLKMSDVSKQKRFETELNGRLTPRHTVGQAVEHYRQHMHLVGDETRFSAFSRGVKLDSKTPLEDLPEEDTDWLVMPEVAAG